MNRRAFVAGLLSLPVVARFARRAKPKTRLDIGDGVFAFSLGEQVCTNSLSRSASLRESSMRTVVAINYAEGWMDIA